MEVTSKNYSDIIHASNALAGGTEITEVNSPSLLYSHPPLAKPTTHYQRLIAEVLQNNSADEWAPAWTIQEIKETTEQQISEAIAELEQLHTPETDSLARQMVSLNTLNQLTTKIRLGTATPEDIQQYTRDSFRQMHGTKLEHTEVQPYRTNLATLLQVYPNTDLTSAIASFIAGNPIPETLNLDELTGLLTKITQQKGVELTKKGSTLQKFFTDTCFGSQLQMVPNCNLHYGGISIQLPSPEKSTTQITYNPTKFTSLPELASFLAHEGFPGHAVNSNVIDYSNKTGITHPATKFGIMGGSGVVSLLEGVAMSTTHILQNSLLQLGIPQHKLQLAEALSLYDGLRRHNTLALLATTSQNDDQIEKQITEELGFQTEKTARYLKACRKALDPKNSQKNPHKLIHNIFCLSYFANYFTGKITFEAGLQKKPSQALALAWFLHGFIDLIEFKKAMNLN